MAEEQGGDSVQVYFSYQKIEVERTERVFYLEEDVYDAWVKFALEAGHADAGELFRMIAMKTFKFFLEAM